MKIIKSQLIAIIREAISDIRDNTAYVNEAIDNRHDISQKSLQSGNISNNPIQIQIVDDDEGRRKGLMFRQNMPENEGMLFIHDATDMCGYYMKNTYIPLSIAFADDEGVIFQIEDMKPRDMTSVMSIQPALYALEMNMGWFDYNNIKIGDMIEF